MAAKSKSKSSKTDYLKGVLTAELIEEFLQEPGIPGWMGDLCALLTKALEEELLEDPSAPHRTYGSCSLRNIMNMARISQGSWVEIWQVAIQAKKSTTQLLFLVAQGKEIPSVPEIKKQLHGELVWR